MSSPEKIKCPSAPCKEGNVLFGRVLADKTVSYLEEPVVVTSVFVEASKAGRAPEQRFRFTAPCAQSSCKNWKDERCGLIDEVERALAPQAQLNPEVRACSLRATCRWFLQKQEAACVACKFVQRESFSEIGR